MLPPRPFRLLLPLAVALSALAPAAAWAQAASTAPGAAPPQPAAAPVVTMPVVKQNEGVTYPRAALDAGIHDTVEVSLILTIDATGIVTRAVVEKPVGHGFDEAAVEAAQKLTFEPATRDGKPVAAQDALRLSLHASRRPPSPAGWSRTCRRATHRRARPSSSAMPPASERTTTRQSTGRGGSRACRPAPTT